MYRSRTSKQEMWRRIRTYTILPVLVTASVAMIALYIIGYRYDLQTQRLEQGGLVQVMTKPTDAQIEIDGRVYQNRTNTRIDATTGAHTITISKQGYSSWQKTVVVEAGKILWLNYVKLIPDSLEPVRLASYERVDDSAVATKRNTMLVLPDEKTPQFQVVNVTGSTDQKQAMIALPATKYDQKSKPIFSIYSYERNGRYAVLQAKGKTTEWIVFDTARPEASVNVTALAKQSISWASFFADNPNKLYVVANRSLRLVDLANGTMSGALIANVADIGLSEENVISYVTLPDNKTSQASVGYYTPGAEQPKVVQRIYTKDDNVPVRFRIAEYFGDTYAALQQGSVLTVSLLSKMASDSHDAATLTPIESIMLGEPADDISFSPKQRFILAQRKSTFTTYDLELHKITTATVKGNAAMTRPLMWLGEYHLWSDRDGQLRLYEFDGANSQVVAPVLSGHSVLMSHDDKYIAYFFKTADQVEIRRVQLLR